MSAPANRLAPALLLVWGLAATAFVGMGMLPRMPFPPPVFVGLGVLLSLIFLIFVPGFAAWVKTVDIRWILGFHLVRFVGIYFLILASQGRLDDYFARTAGIGDIITATGAVALILIPAAREGLGLKIWNAFGFADILFVVFNAARVVRTAPERFTEFFHLPLGLLPTFIVPVIVVSHVVILFRLRRAAA
ncbi:MAG TPA: hypothetical protein VL295_02595 [Gemmatimonadales bacterium]|nr:hypothetical protein [Gemmatimonadales bacterium]